MAMNQNSLKYRSLDVQGECLLKEIRLVKKNEVKFILFIILCIFTVGIPQLLIFWYPRLKRYLYYDYTQQRSQASHFWIKNYDQEITIVQKKTFTILQTQTQPFQTVGFENRYLKYYIDQSDQIRAIRYDVDKKILGIIEQQRRKEYLGLSFGSAADLTQCYGLGAMVIEKPSLFRLFVHEIFRPMFLFIIYSIIVWLITQYFFYVSIIIITTIISLAINLHQTNKLNNKINSMAYYETQLNVLRQGKITRISSLEVVPGDVVFLGNLSESSSHFKLPFDGKVLEGSLLINQCSLTGESVPVVKKACKDLHNLSNDKGCIVYQGTTLMQVNSNLTFKYFERYRQAYGVPVCVHKTNFYTSKGSLIRIIKFPKQQQNIFQRQSSKFLIFIFFLTILTYGILAAVHSQIVGAKQILLKIMQLVTITVPPGLPVSMTLGIIYAVQKLQKKNIYCTSQNNIVKGGRVEHVCFDKTGTLTQNFMDLYGVLPYFNGQFLDLIRNCDQQYNQDIVQAHGNIVNFRNVLYNFGSNHSLIQNLRTKQIIGDPMQLKVFQFGDFRFDYSNQKKDSSDVMFSFRNQHGIQGQVHKVFQFDSDVQRMSVVCKTADSQFHLFCKGSPEMLKTLFDPSSVDYKSYDDSLKSYSSQGYRILAIGSKKIDFNPSKSRQELQMGIQFQGFTIFQNMLKPESHEAILQLKQADIQCSMITGDSSLTACCIGLQCQIADRNKDMLIFDRTKDTLKYQQFNSNQKQNQLNVPKTQKQIQNMVIMICRRYPNHQICLTGNIFATLFQGNDHMVYSYQLKQIFMRTSIFARAKPNQKAKIVSIYQSFGKVMGMCGDGANDCGALKQAQIGLSLSQTQASISAPFTSKVFNIQPMVQLIKQCRSALATNFSLFNIMTMYSLIQYTTAWICQYFYSYPNDLKFVYWDIAGNFILLLTYGNIGTAQKLTKQKPLNSLFSLANICQLLSMFFVQLIGQVVCIYVTLQVFTQKIDYYSNGGHDYNIRYYKENGSFLQDSSQTNVLFVFTNFFYLASFVGFSIQRPWRERFYTSAPFLITFLILVTYATLIILVPALRFSFWKLDKLNNNQMNLALFCLSGIFSWIIYTNQKYILEPLSNWMRRQSRFANQYL